VAQSIFERHGGFATVRRIVSEFYDRVLDSPRLAPYFAGVEMRRLIDHQTKFVASVMGGPASFSGDALRRVHQPLGITAEEFQELVDLMRETLEDFDFDEADIRTVVGNITRHEGEIVRRG